MTRPHKGVLVTGGGTFLGDNIAMALLAEGVDVTLLVRPGAEDKLGLLAQRTRWYPADVWDTASLRGRARGHQSVIHTVGSMVAEPSVGLTFHRLNFLSARNVANMCVSDGVQHMVLMSAVRTPWMSLQYIQAKREAENYLFRVGLDASIIHAPMVYQRGRSRPMVYRLFSFLGRTPPFSWFLLGNRAPIPIDVLARGVSRIATQPDSSKTIYSARDLWKLNSKAERKGKTALLPATDMTRTETITDPFHGLDEDIPLGWSADE